MHLDPQQREANWDAMEVGKVSLASKEENSNSFNPLSLPEGVSHESILLLLLLL